MNAVEFVKKHGIKEAIKVVELHPVSTLINIGGSCVSVLDLKQIVDAFELVESYGGLSEAKELHYDEFCSDTTYNKLQKSINLVGQCNA